MYGSSALTAELLQRALPERTSEKYLARANALTKRRTAHLLMKRGVDPVEEINESLLRKVRPAECACVGCRQSMARRQAGRAADRPSRVMALGSCE